MEDSDRKALPLETSEKLTCALPEGNRVCLVLVATTPALLGTGSVDHKAGPNPHSIYSNWKTPGPLPGPSEDSPGWLWGLWGTRDHPSIPFFSLPQPLPTPSLNYYLSLFFFKWMPYFLDKYF